MYLDAHQHFWQFDSAEYAWIDAERHVIQADFLPDDLAPHLQQAGLEGSVAVQARQTVAETEWLLSLADAYPIVKGVVGWLDLQSPDLPAQLERFADHPAFVGVRHVLQDDPDDRLMLRPAFLRGIAALGDHDLAYDILIYPRHLPISAELVQQFPQQRFVVDHLAKPFIKAGTLEPWASDLKALAQFPNVTCKLSGLVTEAAWGGWARADFVPYIDAALEAFGPERLMFGSDWPVCLLSASYTDVVEIVASQLSETEKESVFGRVAADFYAIK